MSDADAIDAASEGDSSLRLFLYREALEAARASLARVEGERDRWKDTALTIQRNLADTHKREKRAEWLRGHTEAFEDAAAAYEAKLAAAESAAERRGEALRRARDLAAKARGHHGRNAEIDALEAHLRAALPPSEGRDT